MVCIQLHVKLLRLLDFVKSLHHVVVVGLDIAKAQGR
jgi:hypothetical protein